MNEITKKVEEILDEYEMRADFHLVAKSITSLIEKDYVKRDEVERECDARIKLADEKRISKIFGKWIINNEYARNELVGAISRYINKKD